MKRLTTLLFGLITSVASLAAQPLLNPTELLTKLVESGSSSGAAPAAGQTDSSFKTTMLAEPRSNAVILRAANPARVSLVKSLIAKLDQPTMSGSNGDAGNIYVVYLKNTARVIVSVPMLARSISAEVDADSLEVLESAEPPRTAAA